MLSSEEMSALQEDETYRATRSWKYNWRYAKRALNLGFNELALHSPRDKDRCSATGFQRLLWPISKRWVIAKEIGQFRNDVIENAFTPGVRKLDFEQILSKGDYIWMELDAKKLKFIREITILFLADIQVSAALYHYSHILKKEEEYRKIEKEIEEQYLISIGDQEGLDCSGSFTPSGVGSKGAIIKAVAAAFTEGSQYE